MDVHIPEGAAQVSDSEQDNRSASIVTAMLNLRNA